MSTKKTLKEIKEDLRVIFGSSNCFELIQFYDYVSKSDFSKKITESKINKNNYLDNKIRVAFDQLLENSKPSYLIDLWNFVVNKKGNTQQFFEWVDRERAEKMGKFGTAMKSLLSKIESKGFEVNVDAQPGEGTLSIEFMTSQEACYMDFIDFLREEFFEKEDNDKTWMLTAKSGNLVVLNYLPVQSTAEVEEKLDDPIEDEIEDETEDMGKKKTYGTGVDPASDKNKISVKEWNTWLK